MNYSTLHYQSESSLNSVNENLKVLSEFFVKTKQARCSCTVFKNGEIKKAKCKRCNKNFQNIYLPAFDMLNDKFSAKIIVKNKLNQDFFCENINSYIILYKQYYNKKLLLIFAFEEDYPKHSESIISHFDSLFNFIIKSNYYDDLNNNMNIDFRNLIFIIDEHGYLLHVTTMIQNLLGLNFEYQNINIIDLFEEQRDSWIDKVNDVLNFKPFVICDSPLKNKKGSIQIRKKIFKGLWSGRQVLFITSSDLFKVDILPKYDMVLKNTENYSPKIEKNQPKIKLKTKNNINVYDLDDIIYCKLLSNYLEIYFKNNSKTTIYNENKELSERILMSSFFQIHKSYIINLNYVKSFSKQDGGYVILVNDVRLSVAARRKSQFFKVISEYFL